MTEKAYAVQKNALTSGSFEKPAVALDLHYQDMKGVRYVRVELFAPKNTEDELRLMYLGVPSVDESDDIAISAGLETAVVYYVTSLVMVVLGDTRANDMATLAHVNMGRGDAVGSKE